MRVSSLPDGCFGRQRGATGLRDGHRSRIAEFVTNDEAIVLPLGIEAARLKTLAPEGARLGDDQREAGQLAVLGDRWSERQLQRRSARVTSVIFGIFGSEPDRLAGPAPYMHRTSILTPASTGLLA